MSTAITRRLAIGLLVGFSVLQSRIGSFGVDPDDGGFPRSLTNRLLGTVSNLDSAAEIGRQYLDMEPEPGSELHLVHRFALDLGLSVRDIRTIGSDALGSLIKDTVREDFRNDRVGSVDGWILSHTELRLYSLAAIVRAA